jgi:hypothetical protein
MPTHTKRSRSESLSPPADGLSQQERIAKAAHEYLHPKRGQPQPSYRGTAEKWGISKHQLENAVKNNGAVVGRGHPTALTGEEEQELVDYVMQQQERGRGVGKTGLYTKLGSIYSRREQQGKPLPNGGKPLGKKWLHGWMARHNISLRKPSAITGKRWAAANDHAALEEWFDSTWAPTLNKVCIRERGDGRQWVTSTYRDNPDRIYNFDETGMQLDGWVKVFTVKGAKRAFKQQSSYAKRSITCIALGSAKGQVIAPNYVYKGKLLTHNALGGVRFYQQSGIIAKGKTHVVDGRILPLALERMAQQIPGGVSCNRRALLLVDGHVSRLSDSTKEAARRLGFDLVLLPPSCTHFLQPWDKLFSSVKAKYGELMAAAAVHSGYDSSTTDFKPPLSQVISIADAALFYSVGHSNQPLQRAFSMTGLYPPSKQQLLAAAKAANAVGKQQPSHKAWTPMQVSPQMIKDAVAHSAQQQPTLHLPAQDKFLSMDELAAEVSRRLQRPKKRART